MEKDKVSGIYYPKYLISKTTAVVFGGNIGFGFGETKQFGRDHKLLCIFENKNGSKTSEDLKKNYSVFEPQVHLAFKNKESINGLIGALELLKEEFKE